VKIFKSPYREYLTIILILFSGVVYFIFPASWPLLLVSAMLGSITTVLEALVAIRKKSINISTFNSFAIIVSFATGEITSAAFIVLMLSFASLLGFRTTSRARNAIEELLKLKPLRALVEKNGQLEEIDITQVKSGDILVVNNGAQIPVDGTVISGEGEINEASVTGESKPVTKIYGDKVLSATWCESGVIKIKATGVGKDSTIERLIELVKKATEQKSKPEQIADRFAKIFLPIVILIGLGTYLITKNISMTAAIFLVACADDIAVAIPLAITAALGKSAKDGVIVKGGAWFETLSKMKTLVLDKTGTLTYGIMKIEKTIIEPGVSETEFWKLVAIAEKFSEHPIGHATLREANKHTKEISDPDYFKSIKGSGVIASSSGREIVIGNHDILATAGLPDNLWPKDKLNGDGESISFAVFIDKKYAGAIMINDIPKEDAAKSLKAIQDLGIQVMMFTGDNEKTASRIAGILGIKEFTAGMKPEDKLKRIEELCKVSIVGMVGDGINDAPALSRADVGIAMGKGGAAVTVETADVVILTDDLNRLPEMIKLARQTMKIIRGDMWIWGSSNIFGFTLVLTGIFGPALAAFYNFISDFFPLLNSARLFRKN